MRDNAGKDFFEAWAKNADGMDVIRIWLKAATTRKEVNGKREADETLMPLLNVCCIIIDNANSFLRRETAPLIHFLLSRYSGYREITPWDRRAASG